MNKKKFALITGSSSGLGFEFSKELAQLGYNVILTGRNLENLKMRKDFIENHYNVEAKILNFDLSISHDAHSLFNNCKDLDIEVLINNAGVGLFGTVENIDDNDIESMLNLNITSLTILSNLFCRMFIKKGQGYILNIGSMAGNQPTPYFSSYAASKSYVIKYSLALREEVKKYGVKVSCVLPGYIKTSFDENSKIVNKKYLKFSEKNALKPEIVAKVGIKLMFKNKAYSVIGGKNKIASFFTSLIGKKLQPVLVYKFITSMLKG